MFDFLEPTNIGPKKNDDELELLASATDESKAPRAFDAANLSESSGIPAEIIDELNHNKRKELRMQRMIHDIPADSSLRAYFTDPNAVVMAEPDVPMFTKMEQLARQAGRNYIDFHVAAAESLMLLPQAAALGWERGEETTRSSRQAFADAWQKRQESVQTPVRSPEAIRKDLDELETTMLMSSAGTDLARPEDARGTESYERQRIMLERELAEAQARQAPDADEIPNILTREAAEIRRETAAKKSQRKVESLSQAINALGYNENYMTAAAVSTTELAGQMANRITEGYTGEAVAVGAAAGLAVAIGAKAAPAYLALKGVSVLGATLPAWLTPVAVGAGIGYRVGSSADTFEAYAGSIYSELGELRDANGRPISEDVKWKAAILTGSLTALLEGTLGYASAKLLAQITPAKAAAMHTAKELVMQGTKRVLLSETGRQAVSTVMKDYGRGVIGGVTNEVLQEAVQVFVKELVKDETTQRGLNAFIDIKNIGDWYGIMGEEAMSRYKEVAKSMFLGSMGLGFPSMAVTAAARLGQANRANAYLAHMREAHANMQSTNMAQQSVVEAVKVAKHIGYNQEVFIAADDLRVIAEQNPDVLKKLGITEKDLEAAAAEGRPTGVSEADIITKLTQEELDLVSPKLVMEDIGISAEKAIDLTNEKVVEHTKNLLAEMRSEQNTFKTAFEKLTTTLGKIAETKGWSDDYAVDVMQTVEAFAYRNAVGEGQNISDFITRLDIEDLTDRVEHSKQATAGQRVAGRMVPVDNRYLIQVFQDADMSTVLHELGHVFLSEMEYLNVDNKGSDRLRKDLKILNRWFESQAGRNTKNLPPEIFRQELFARGFEKYLMDGKAPAPDLVPTFNNYREWLKSVYHQVSNVDSAAGFEVRLDPKVREVFDRMIATDVQIDMAAMDYDIALTPQTMKEVGMTKAEQEQARNLLNAARKNAKIQLQHEKDQWNQMRVRLWTEHAKQIIEGNKVYQDRDAVVDMPLDKEMLDKLLGKERANEFSNTRIGFTKKGSGNDPEFVAHKLGYRNADEMVTILMNAPTKKAFIDDYVADQRQKWEDSNMSAEEALFAQSKLDEYMESVGRILSRQLNLTKDVRTARLLKQKAEREIGNTLVSEAVLADKYMRQYKIALSEHQNLLRSTRPDKFVDALKQLERARDMMAKSRAARKAAKRIDSIERRNKKFLKSKTKPQLDFNKHLINTLHAMGLSDKGATPGSAISQVLADFGLEVMAPPVVDPEVLGKLSPGTDYRRVLTVNEAEQMFDYTQWLHDFGVKLQEGRLSSTNMTVSELVGKLSEPIVAMADKGTPAAEGSLRRKWGKMFDRAVAHTLKLQTIFRVLDGFDRKNTGVHMMNLWAPLNQALDRAGRRMDEMTAVLKPRLDYIAARSQQMPETLTPANTRKNIPPVPKLMADQNMQWTFERAFVVALYQGDNYNRQAILDGYNLTQAQVDDLLTVLDDKDWDAVIAIRQVIADQWPSLEKAYESMNLVRPKKTTGADYVTASGRVIPGGHYPVRFDSELSLRVDKNVKADDLMSSVYAAFRNPKTPDGLMKERKGTAALPVSLNLQNLATHLAHTTMYSEAAPIISDMGRVFNNPEYAKAVTETMGKEVYDQLMPALQRIAQGDADKLMVATNRVFNAARSMVTAAALSAKPQVAVKQPLSYLTFLRKFGRIEGLTGAADYYWNWRQNKETAKSLSQLMKHRAELIDETLGDLLRMGHNAKSMTEKARAFTEKVFYLPITLMDALVSFPVWHAAYNRGLKNGMTTVDAATFADTWVAETNPSTRVQDKSWLLAQRTSVYAAFNLFAGWTHTHANEIYFNIMGAKKGRVTPLQFLDFVLTDMVLSPMLGHVMINMLRGDEPVPEPEKLAVDMLSYNVAGAPILGDVAVFAARAVTDQMAFTPGQSPMFMVFEVAVQQIRELIDTEQPDRAERLAWSIARTLSFMYKIPVTRVYEDFIEGWRQYQQGGVATNLLFPDPAKK